MRTDHGFINSRVVRTHVPSDGQSMGDAGMAEHPVPPSVHSKSPEAAMASEASMPPGRRTHTR